MYCRMLIRAQRVYFTMLIGLRKCVQQDVSKGSTCALQDVNRGSENVYCWVLIVV